MIWNEDTRYAYKQSSACCIECRDSPKTKRRARCSLTCPWRRVPIIAPRVVLHAAALSSLSLLPIQKGFCSVGYRRSAEKSLLTLPTTRMLTRICVLSEAFHKNLCSLDYRHKAGTRVYLVENGSVFWKGGSDPKCMRFLLGNYETISNTEGVWYSR